jgi:hypothetical protein
VTLPCIVVSFKPSNTLPHTLDIGNSDALISGERSDTSWIAWRWPIVNVDKFYTYAIGICQGMLFFCQVIVLNEILIVGIKIACKYSGG